MLGFGGFGGYCRGSRSRRTWQAVLGADPACADWRCLLDRDDSPWYPTMRLFRQNASGDWASVVEKVVDDLRESLN
jgi:hypothetical protein